MELFKNTNFDFLGKKWPFIIASLVLTAWGIVDLAMKGGPRYGIDFKGGANLYVKFNQMPPVDRIRAALGARIPGEVSVQEIRDAAGGGTSELLIGTEMRDETGLQENRRVMLEVLAANFGGADASKLDLNNSPREALPARLAGPVQTAGIAMSAQELDDLAKAVFDFRDSAQAGGLLKSVDQLSGVPAVAARPQLLGVLKQECTTGNYAIRQVEVVGPKIGEELRQQALMATLLALAGMLVYIAFRFEWIYGVAAVIAVFHDTIITVGLFSIFNKEINLTVVAALLTLVGYSMNDTIVVFDRIRENLKLYRREGFATLVNTSINQTLSRTILTSGLTFLTAIALFLFGGSVLHGFSFALVVGILIGTYSSVFVASPILIFWQEFAEKRKKGGQTAVAAAASGATRRAPAKTAK